MADPALRNFAHGLLWEGQKEHRQAGLEIETWMGIVMAIGEPGDWRVRERLLGLQAAQRQAGLKMWAAMILLGVADA